MPARRRPSTPGPQTLAAAVLTLGLLLLAAGGEAQQCEPLVGIYGSTGDGSAVPEDMLLTLGRRVPGGNYTTYGGIPYPEAHLVMGGGPDYEFKGAINGWFEEYGGSAHCG